MEFECLLTVRAECQSQNWADIMRKLGAMLGEDSEVL